MDDLKEILEKRLEEKREIYNAKLNSLMTLCKTEKETDYFEDNVMSILFILKKIKSEINQIKDIIMLINMLR